MYVKFAKRINNYPLNKKLEKMIHCVISVYSDGINLKTVKRKNTDCLQQTYTCLELYSSLKLIILNNYYIIYFYFYF